MAAQNVNRPEEVNTNTSGLRRFDRVACYVEVTYLFQGHPHNGIVRQLSIGGAFVESAEATSMERGDQIVLWLSLSDPPVRHVVKATVIYQTTVDDTKTEGLEIGFGLRFSDVDEATTEALQAIVDSQRTAGHLLYDSKGRRAVEEAWRLSRFLRRVFDSASVWLSVFDEHGNTVLWNRAAEDISGYSRNEVFGHDNVVPWLYPDEIDLRHFEALAEGVMKGCGQVQGHESTIRTKTGQRRSLSFDMSGLEESGIRAGLILMGRDITELRETESRLHQAQKLEAVGRIAGGVAHDFNNMLTVIMVATENLGRLIGPGSPLLEDIESIRRCTNQAAELTRHLVAFGRKQILNPVELDLNQLVQEARPMLERVLGDDVDCLTFLDPTLNAVRADPLQLQQVLVNLVLNAHAAMPEGGTLTIETQNIDLDVKYSSRHDVVPPGPYVLLSVADTGCGMDETTMANIFEPFFTTKPEGAGTGLGLSTVYGVVKQSNGFVWVYSEPDQGTTFKLYLPRIPGEISVPAEQLGVSEAPDGTETILLAEDRAELRSLISDKLRDRGYTILEAKDGVDAESLAASYPGEIHVLLTDMVMPRMGGPELARRLALRRPETKTLYMSGYSEQLVVHQGLLTDEDNFLQKPFPISLAARKIRALLDDA